LPLRSRQFRAVSQGNAGVIIMPTGEMFLDIALGAAYTLLSIGSDPKTLHQNNGKFFVAGNLREFL